MEGRDLIGRAKTGSGKTLAFALPIVEGLLEVRPGCCLPVCPLRAHCSCLWLLLLHRIPTCDSASASSTSVER